MQAGHHQKDIDCVYETSVISAIMFLVKEITLYECRGAVGKQNQLELHEAQTSF